MSDCGWRWGSSTTGTSTASTCSRGTTRDLALVPALRPSMEAFRGWLDAAADAILRGRPERATRRRRLRAAVGHALRSETWRSLVLHQGLPRSETIELMEALTTAAKRSELEPSSTRSPPLPASGETQRQLRPTQRSARRIPKPPQATFVAPDEDGRLIAIPESRRIRSKPNDWRKRRAASVPANNGSRPLRPHRSRGRLEYGTGPAHGDQTTQPGDVALGIGPATTLRGNPRGSWTFLHLSDRRSARMGTGARIGRNRP